MNFLQFISIFNYFGFNYNVVESSINQTFQFVSGSFFSVFSFDCLLQNMSDRPANIYVKALAYSLIPVIMTILAGFMRKSKNILVTLSITIFLMQPSILQSLFDILNCANVTNDSYYIFSEMRIACYTKEYNLWIYCLVIPSFLVYVVIIPGYFLLKVWIGLKIYSSHSLFMAKVGFLIHGFKREAFIWEYILLWEKILMIILSIFLQDIYSKAILAIIFFMGMAFLEDIAQPLLSTKLNKLELESHVSLIIILLMKTLKVNNNNIFIDALTSFITLGCEILFLSKCIKHCFLIKISLAKKHLPKKFKDIFQEQQAIFSEDLKSEIKEWCANFKGNKTVIPINSKIIKKIGENQKKNFISESQHQNIQVIKILTHEIEKLKEIIHDLNKNIEILQQRYEAYDNIQSDGQQSLLLSPLFSSNPLLKNKRLTSTESQYNDNQVKKNELQIEKFQDKIPSQSQEEDIESPKINEPFIEKSFKWSFIYKKVKENFEDLKFHAKKLSLRSGGDSKLDFQSDFKHLSIHFNNICGETIYNFKFNIKLSDSI